MKPIPFLYRTTTAVNVSTTLHRLFTILIFLSNFISASPPRSSSIHSFPSKTSQEQNQTRKEWDVKANDKIQHTTSATSFPTHHHSFPYHLYLSLNPSQHHCNIYLKIKLKTDLRNRNSIKN